LDKSKLKFKPSKFNFHNDHIGSLERKYSCWLDDSFILNPEECEEIVRITGSIDGSLIYRATRDGFFSNSFHAKCNGKSNTLAIIKNNQNCVFGAYLSSAWSNGNDWIFDSNAFIFSMRRNGVSNSYKFPINKPQYAVPELFSLTYGAAKSGGFEIRICDRSNENMGSYTNIGNTFECPEGYIHGNDNTKCFISGNYNQWLTTEIEVYQISIFK
jgi:hypothetical protein